MKHLYSLLLAWDLNCTITLPILNHPESRPQLCTESPGMHTHTHTHTHTRTHARTHTTIGSTALESPNKGVTMVCRLTL
jgi:hypothetical protein